MNSTDAPQFAQIQALVEEKRLNIDNFSKYSWPDYVEHTGKVYTKRDPGYAFVNVPFYMFAKIFQDNINGIKIPSQILKEWDLKIALITYGLSSAWTVLMLYIFSQILEYLEIDKRIIILMTLSLGLGTLFWRQSYSFTRQPFVSLVLLVTLLYYMKNNFIKSLYLTSFSIGVISFIDLTATILFIPIVCVNLFDLLKNESNLKLIGWVKTIALLCLFLLVGMVPLLIYNKTAYGEIFKPSYVDDQYLDFDNVSNYFLANPLKVIPSVLFSWNKQPNHNTVEHFNNFPELRYKLGIEWFLKRNFEGIFYISPILFGMFCLVIRQKKKQNKKEFTILILLTSILWLVFISKYTAFMASNAFNTYYYLPIVPLLFALCSLGIQTAIDKTKNNMLLRSVVLLFLFSTSVVSIKNGLRNNLTNYLPHITGDFRVDPQLLDGKSIGYMLNNYFSSVFPNFSNLHIGIVFIGICLIILQIRKTLSSIKQK